MSARLVLASQSPQRQTAIMALGIPFVCKPANIDEKSIQHSDPAERAKLIAVAKGKLVSEHYPHQVVVAGDTFAQCEGKTLEKPASLEEAAEMLRFQSGKEIKVYSGLFYADHNNSIVHEDSVVASVTFRKLSEAEIQHYVQTQPVTTWSAAFSLAYPAGCLLIDSTTGSFTSIVYGLPMELICTYLQQSGLYR